MKDGISVSGFERTAKPIDERLDELEKSIPEAEAQIDILKDNALNEDTLQQEGRNLYDKWNSLSDKEKISVIQTLTDSIRVCNEEVEINLHFSPVLVNDGNFYTQPVG
ncbi:MAG: hypothetical protein PSN36_04685 [Gammaproteobacteria bacterium]|nr:hypothetical protein [Gammaproteobacteria bacterium]